MSGVLDVACGLRPRGNVNVDLYLAGDTKHRRGGKGPELRIEDIPGFVQADALDMYMFEDKQFDTVHCWGLMEHLPYPKCWDLLRELWRVTGHHLIVVVPNRYWTGLRNEVHISNYDAVTFRKAVPAILGTHNFEAENEYRGVFHKMIPFPLWPRTVRLDVWRDKNE